MHSNKLPQPNRGERYHRRCGTHNQRSSERLQERTCNWKLSPSLYHWVLSFFEILTSYITLRVPVLCSLHYHSTSLTEQNIIICTTGTPIFIPLCHHLFPHRLYHLPTQIIVFPWWKAIHSLTDKNNRPPDHKLARLQSEDIPSLNLKTSYTEL